VVPNADTLRRRGRLRKRLAERRAAP
jgi:hypothetical protein